MKKKALPVIYTVLCLLVCVLPLLGMLFAPSNEAIGNERLSDFPAFKTEDGHTNKEFLTQLGDYFETHFAFRPQLVSLDAEIQSKLFGTSNLSSVVVGKNGSLFYSSTLDNYLGRNLMSEREIFNIVNNLEITEEYLKGQGVNFLFTVAPNKNTLYSGDMPYYYSVKESKERNLDKLNNALKDSEVNYCNLEELFKSQNEVLYFKRDSHWNEKGALLAYSKMLDSLSKAHNNYEDAQVIRSKTFKGDLAKMIYPKSGEPEFRYNYDINNYNYTTPTKSVEEAIIATENKEGTGSLYMYRDSFGNSLIPFFASAYNKAYFTKAFPVNLELETGTQKSDTVIFEIVERNLSWFSENPPVFSSPEYDIPVFKESDIKAKNSKAQISSVNITLACISGELSSDNIKNNSEIYLLVTDKDGNERLFEAFTTSTDNSDFGYTAYIPETVLDGSAVKVQPIVKTDNDYYASQSETLKLEQVEF